MTDQTNTANDSSMTDANLKSQEMAPQAHPIPIDQFDTVNLPVSVELERHKGLIRLKESPFSREQWLDMLSQPSVNLPECLDGIEPFFFDMGHFQSQEEDDGVLNRPAHPSELTSDFWQGVGPDRLVRAVVVNESLRVFKTFFVSVPARMPLSEGVQFLRIHAATIDTVDPEVLWYNFDPRSLSPVWNTKEIKN